MNTTTRELTVKETAAALRAHLKAQFPHARFSVTMDRGTAHGWLNVQWADGPTVDQVNEITAAYESSRFSGMDDAYHETGATVTVNGEEVRPRSRGIIPARRYSEASLAWAREQTGHTGDLAAGEEIGTDEYSVSATFSLSEVHALYLWLNGREVPAL